MQNVQTLDLDPFSTENLTDPYPMHEKIRESGPVVWLDRYRCYGVSRYEEVHHMLVNHEVYVSSRGVGLTDFAKEKPFRPPSLLLESDPPNHSRARGVVDKVLTPKTVRGLQKHFQEAAHEIVEGLVNKGEFDGVAELAAAFPLRVFPDWIGLPKEGRENLLPYGNMVFNTFGPMNSLYEEAVQKGQAAAAWIQEQSRPGNPVKGSFADQLHEAAAEAGYDEEEQARLFRSFLTAGVDTTVHGIGAALHLLATEPEQFEKLKSNPKLARSAFEETVRFVAPVQTFFRTVNEDTELSGVELPEGSKVLMFLSGANRDPRQWENPDTFDIERRAAGHVGFGYGIHACVGQMIARLEAQCVLTAVADKVASMRLTGEPKLKLNNTLRGWEYLPMEFIGK